MNLAQRYSDFLALLDATFDPSACADIERALALADEKMTALKRYDSSPMLDHDVGVARIVIAEIGLGRNSTIATLLHDVVRLGLLGLEEMGGMFGAECVEIVRGLCNISQVQPKHTAAQADNFRELIVSYSTDPRVILIKLADRLEVMRHLRMFPEAKRRAKSWESLHLYAQIAHKLGLYAVKSELEDIALSYLEPADYTSIEHKLEETAAEREKFIAGFLKPIVAKLNTSGINYQIKSRTKSIFSIWSKMRKQHVPFEEVFDIFALRIIVDARPEQEKQACWAVYSIVTDFYTPNPERMRDWISIPKSNGYESLHTTVVTRDGHWVEIQIRTERMDAVAERGIAAHWRYKGASQAGLGHEEWLARLRELMETTDSEQIAQRFDTHLSSREIFVFTPAGDLRKLADGSSVLDFAFDIHTSIGCTCTGARINGRNVPIKEPLRNGDIVEILTSKSQHPKADWLSIVRSSKARTKIRSYLREQAAKTATLGREELERKLKNWKIATPIDEVVALLAKHYKCKTGTELYARIASEAIDLQAAKEILLRGPEGPLIQESSTKSVVQKVSEEKDALVIDERISGLDYKMAKCCRPIFGDEVFGFVTVNAGITIHRDDCPNASRLRELYPYRVLPARWRSTPSAGGFLTSIRIVADDSTGMVNRIGEVVAQELKLVIRSMNIASEKGVLQGVINVEVPGANAVDLLIHSILRIKGVQKAYRVNQ